MGVTVCQLSFIYKNRQRAEFGPDQFDRGFPVGTEVENPPANAGDMGSIPGLGRYPGGGNGNPLQFPCQENAMDRGAWGATVHAVTKEYTRLND